MAQRTRGIYETLDCRGWKLCNLLHFSPARVELGNGEAGRRDRQLLLFPESGLCNTETFTVVLLNAPQQRCFES